MSKPAAGKSAGKYCGRFAPSPSGPLHFGSLIAAVGSYLQARSQQGEWLVRIDDIDPPREVAGASELILQTLETFGFEWDGPVSYQSQRSEHYQAALERLQQLGYAYPCACTRKENSAAEQRPGIYPGTCRDGLPEAKVAKQLRVKTGDNSVSFIDALQGPQCFDLATEVGDFIVLRADGYFAYQLATAIDDVAQGITEVVRGCDLLDSTARQIYLQQLLGLSSPDYCHLPLAINAYGEKLSKQHHADGLDLAHPVPQLWDALLFMGHSVPTTLRKAPLNELWKWALSHWELSQVPYKKMILPDTLHSR